MRQKIVAGNWKMNLDYPNAKQLLTDIIAGCNKNKQEALIIIFPPFLYLKEFAEQIEYLHNIFIGAQNCSDKNDGAYTGEVSAKMLKSVNVKYILAGHSERRSYFGETNSQVASKIDLMFEHEMIPVFCCGESIIHRKSNNYLKFVTTQVEESLFHLTNEQISKIIIAYEPVWAIGTGENASPLQAQEMHAYIRSLIAGKYGDKTAQNMPILYGGSCNSKNAPGIFSQKDVDGGLIGGASLKADDFIAITDSF
jgi:triosephosphate isomerase (TIM)